MTIVITSIRLKSFFHFFQFSILTVRSIQQLKRDHPRVVFHSSGFPITFYTLSVWDDATEIKSYIKSGHHLNAMKASGKVANRIQTYSYECEYIPTWKEAKEKLKAGRILTF
jgi:hypothetical protein